MLFRQILKFINNKGKLALLFLILFGAVAVTPANAAGSNWATLGSIRDLTDNVTLQSDQPLIAGHAYNMTFTIDVPFTQAQSEFSVSLDSAMTQQTTQFWYLYTSNYPGYNATKFTAGLHSISFNQVQGQFILSVVFMVPQSYTVATAGGLSLHFITNNVTLVGVSVTGGSIVGTIPRNISDESIQNYLSAYAQKSTLISQGKIDSAYSSLVNGILVQSQAVYTMGLPVKALDIINNIDQNNFPAPPNNSFNIILLGVVGVLAAIAVLLVVMLMRSKGKTSLASGAMSDAQRELASLEVMAAQYDKKLAERLKALKNKIGESI